MQDVINVIRQEESNQVLILDSINLTTDLLTDIINQINETNEFEIELSEILNQRLISLTSSLTQFIEVSTLLYKASQQNFSKLQTPIKNSHIHLLFVLKGIVQANAKNDFIVLEDLIKHELKDNLTQWKINFIPTLKKSLSL